LTIPLPWLPNFISLLRLFASPFVAWLLYTNSYRAALFVLLAAGLTDWLDGYTARKLHANDHFGQTRAHERLGVILDPLADKVLLVVVFVAMGLLGLLPFWLFMLVVGRDLVIVTGSLLLRLLRNRREFVPSLLGKVSTFFQILIALLAVVYAAFPHPFIGWLKDTGVLLTAIFTLLSGLDYVRQGIQMARLPALEKI
jgi:cardiolipin synthase (CMP-forming)